MKYFVTDLATAKILVDEINQRAINSGIFVDGITIKVVEVLELLNNKGAIGICENNDGIYLQFYMQEQLDGARDLLSEEKIKSDILI